MSNPRATLPPFVSSISDPVRAEIETELARIEAEHQVQILFAIESGSRAWGFPSPDSDYDVRFVYVHRRDWYLTIWPGRDVIERPISDDLDIGGWDLKKALGLMMKPNPVLYEWLSSPIRYRWRQADCDKLVAFSQKPAHSSACLYHYLHLGRRQTKLHFGDGDGGTVRLKKYFYVLRPALAIRWMRLRPDDIPPMNIQQLVNGLEMDPALVDQIDALITRKATLAESREVERFPDLERFMAEEFDWAEQADKTKFTGRLRDQADSLFREIVAAREDCLQRKNQSLKPRLPYSL
ncbi:MAG: nucleotidyltransferase domain-containing protein [Rhodospirillaceae bacterium]